MQGEFTHHVAPFAGRDHLAVRETHRMQRPVDLADEGGVVLDDDKEDDDEQEEQEEQREEDDNF